MISTTKKGKYGAVKDWFRNLSNLSWYKFNLECCNYTMFFVLLCFGHAVNLTGFMAWILAPQSGIEPVPPAEPLDYQGISM